jgi:hypothetical protein
MQFIGEGTSLKKGGSIEKKDLSKLLPEDNCGLAIAMSAEDWETKYKEIWTKFQDEKSKATILRDRMSTKQERYIGREQEYRKTIESIEKQIEDKSSKPLQIIHEHSEKELLLMGMDPSQKEMVEMMEREKRLKMKNEQQIDQKNVKEIHNNYDKILEQICTI